MDSQSRATFTRGRPNFMNNIMDDIFHAEEPICQIIATKPKAKSKEEDMFRKLRPWRGACDDYNISQTDVKMDAKVTKIHLRQTVAEYIPYLRDAPPPPPPEKIHKWFSGGPPKWIFFNEKWRKRMEKMQEIYRASLQERIKQRKNAHLGKVMKKHRQMLDLVGPAWFQELSPKQMATVDDLKNCILKDIAEGIIENTKDNIAQLGLVLRPNHKHIEKALKNCCKCPVEFLLILYQLINPTRKKYSINDRLLLSAVVHLSMKDTLKELHIRIPSPPPPQKIKKKPIKKQKAIKYESPYLEPYTFVREPPKFTGIYRNKHRQYPESPYFCYLEELRKRINGVFQEPKISKKVKPDTEIDEETIFAQTIYEQLVDYRPVRQLLKPSRYTPCYNFRNPRPPEGIELMTDLLNYFQSCELEGEEEEDLGELKDLIDVYSKDASQCCCIEEILTSYKCCTVTKDSPTITEITESSTTTCKITCIKKKLLFQEDAETEEQRKKRRKERLVEVHPRPKPVCKCKGESRKFIDTALCMCEECVEDRKKKTTTMVIAGMKEEPEEVIPVIESVIKEPPCPCLTKYEDRVEEYEDFRARRDLVYETTKQREKFVIGGVIKGPAGPTFVNSGLLPNWECICHDRAREAEAERQRIANMPPVPPGRQRYEIGGIRETPKGNVFILEQPLPLEPCECEKLYDKFTDVHSTCLEEYYKYLQQIEDDTEEFLSDMAEDYEETKKHDQIEDDEKVKEDSEEPDRVRPSIEEESSQQDETNTKTEVVNVCDKEIAEFKSDTTPICSEICRIDCDKRIRKAKVRPICSPYCGQVLPTCDDCKCDQLVEIPCIDCTCGPPEVEEEPEEEEVEEEEEKVLKRFFIFKKILCNTKWQMDVIQKALESMADDGYPLAKLPDCHKLPHFKLWMQMRCGKYWTIEEKYDSVLKSKGMWRHLESCNIRKVSMAKVPITRQQAHALDWSKAAYCKKLASDAADKFYRKLRKDRVNYGREYFPSTFSYEFPSANFRDCYFAYTPSKEEDVLSRFVWNRFECKNMADVKHCV